VNPHAAAPGKAVLEGWPEDHPTPRLPADWTWLHVGPNGAHPVVILSDRPSTYAGHWWNRSMTPCPRTNACALCNAGIAAQLRVVLGVFDLRLRGPALLELGQAPAAKLRQLADDAGHLRGLVVALQREASRERGRILVTLPDRDHPAPPDPLPDAPDLRKALVATWARTAERNREP
jgi:hypothetical protein